MKRNIGIIETLILAALFIANPAMAESPQPPTKLVALNLAPDVIYPYQLIPTTNIWTHLLLDTATGRVWQVQFAVGDDAPSAKYDISNSSLLPPSTTPKNGRFTLYPTQNIYTFLLLDRQDSRMWQLQWSTIAENRGIVRTIGQEK